MNGNPAFTDDSLRETVRRMLAAETAQVEQAGRTTNADNDTSINSAPYWALFGGQGADLATTLPAVMSGRYRESNPLGLGGIVAGKAAMMGLVPWLMRKLARDGHPRLSKALGYGVGAAGAVPAAMNVRTMMRTEK